MKRSNARLTDSEAPLQPDGLPRARGLPWVCIVLALWTFLIAIGIEATSRSILVIVFAMSVSLATTVTPLLIYVALNGMAALRFIKVPLVILVLVLLARSALEFGALAAALLAPRA